MDKKQAPNTPAKEEVPTAPATDLSNTVAGGQDGLPTPDTSAADKAAIPGGDVPPPATPPAPETTQEQAGAGETQAKPENEPTVVALLVTAQVEGFRRAGRAWSKTQTRVEVADLSEQQVIALFEESMLDVVGVAA